MNDLAWSIVDGATWDSHLSEFDGACQEQLHAFAHARWPSATIEPVLFFDSDSRPVGGALMIIRSLPLRLGSIAVTKWGPALADSQAVDALQTYRSIITALTQEYAQRRRAMLSVLPRVSVEPENREFTTLLSMGFRPGPQLRAPDRYLVDLRLSDDELRKSTGQKWRNRLTKAEKAGLVFERSGAAGREEFDALFASMIQRKGFVDHSAYETMSALLGHPVEGLRSELFLVRHNERAVAGAVVFKAGDTAVYLYGATNDEALPLSAGHFLQFNIVTWLREHTKARWYNLGGTDGSEGLHIFKKGLVGKAGVIRPFPPSANFAAYPLPAILGTAALKIRNSLEVLKRKVGEMAPSVSR